MNTHTAPIIPGGIIFQTQYWQLSHTWANPQVLMLGHFILKPTSEVNSFTELSPAQLAEFAPTLQKCVQAIQAVLNPVKLYIASFGETEGGLHFHLIPRSNTMPASGTSVLWKLFKDKEYLASAPEAEKIALAVKAQLTPAND